MAQKCRYVEKIDAMKFNYTLLNRFLFVFSFVITSFQMNATGEPSTHFNIFIPPNNDAVRRDVCLIITAIEDSTQFSIIDDDMDGDADDSKSGVLMAGQSYVLYIRDNGVNDDAKYASGGTLKQDGDYFIINSNKLVYASQSTNSDWQHDWVPSVNKSGIGQKFIIYAPLPSSSKRDINVFAYADSTDITIRKISTSPTTITGFTNVDMYSQVIVVQKQLHIGKDIIYSGTEGRDLLESGATYVIESNKPVTVQYGALYGNERDGGGYVPSSNGSSAGELFYFAVPFQAGTTGEQEIRIVSADNNNNITLERYNAGSWVQIKSWTAQANSPVDWVGRNNGNLNYPTVFRAKCSPGKKVCIFEANWLETGSIGTSDMGTMCSSIQGASSGQDFIAYMAPPGNEQNVRNPFTGTLFNQQLTHVYLFASNDTCNVVLKDAYTNGNKFSRTFTILPNRYVDCYLTATEWKNIYNGTGNLSGPERPYLKINSDNPISVFNTNFNDNWMMYFGSSLQQSFGQTSTTSQEISKPGDTVSVTSTLVFNGSTTIDSATVKVTVGTGAKVLNSTLYDATVNDSIVGNISEKSTRTEITFPLQQHLYSTHTYLVTTEIVPQLMYNNGDLLSNNTVISVENTVSGNVNGTFQQSTTSDGLRIQSANTSNLIFSLENFNTDLTNSWTASIVDLNEDGYEDIIISDKDVSKPNLYYQNNQNKTFTKSSISKLTTDIAPTVCTSWGDFNNDGRTDALIVNNTQKINRLLKNNGSFQFSYVPFGEEQDTKKPGYYHSGSFVDYNNDGYLDFFLCNYAPTRFNELYRNNGDETFTLIANDPVVSESYMSIGATWADYDNDGDQDLFVPNGLGENNSFFINNGNGKFTKEKNSIIVNDGGNSVGSCWGDINNDGWLDLFVSNASNENNFLYLNNKNGDFTKVTTGQVVSDGGHSHGCSFADIDNDMDLDLYVSNDQNKKFLYINDGAGNFTRKTDEVVEANYGKSMGHCWFDADRDGDLDLFVPTHSGQKNYFFSNNGNSNHWISLKLTGTISNKGAIGARIKLKSGGIWQSREINSQSGLGGQSSIRSHFGLGSNTIIDSVIINWPSGYKQVISNLTSNTFQTIIEPEGALVKGVVYIDKNDNCIKDSNEPTAATIKINFDQNKSALSTSTGHFLTHLAPGSYSAKIPAQGYWINGCEQQFTVNSLMDTVLLNVPIRSTGNVKNIKVNLCISAMRRGFKNIVNMGVENTGTTTVYNVPLKLTLSSGMTITQATPNYTTYVGNVYTWMIDSIEPGKSLNYTLYDQVSLTKSIGNSLTFNLDASVPNDIDNTDNSVSKEVFVVGAVDPNDLKVSPAGEGENGFIKAGTILTYTIRFQNVGTYLASNVYIEDLLPKELDFDAAQFVMSSHPCSFNIRKDGTVTVLFEDIQLPDSTTDQLKSNGFITFAVPLNHSVKHGAIIQNRASIIFDFEDPIWTNYVVNTLVLEPNDETLIAYPNPTSSVINLKLSSASIEYQSGNFIKSVRLYNQVGELLTSNVCSQWALELTLERYPAGIYTIVVIDAFDHLYHCRVVLNK